MKKWPEDDIAMVETGDWPFQSFKNGMGLVLCVKKPPLVHGHGDYEFGCILPKSKSTVVKSSVWDCQNPNVEKIEYNSVEEMVNDGWMVD